jgi:quercetin dioxygenase-like cupin family protein
MQKFSLDALAREHLERAANSTTHRSAATVYGGHEHALRQTLIALVAGASMAEHDSPGEATLLVLRGRVRLHAGDDTWEGRTGDLLVIPPSRHSVEALEDSVTVLTVSMSGATR